MQFSLSVSMQFKPGSIKISEEGYKDVYLRCQEGDPPRPSDTLSILSSERSELYQSISSDSFFGSKASFQGSAASGPSFSTSSLSTCSSEASSIAACVEAEGNAPRALRISEALSWELSLIFNNNLINTASKSGPKGVRLKIFFAVCLLRCFSPYSFCFVSSFFRVVTNAFSTSALFFGGASSLWTTGIFLGSLDVGFSQGIAGASTRRCDVD